MSKWFCLTLLCLVAPIPASAQYLKVFYAPFKREFIVVQAEFIGKLSLADGRDLTVHIGPANRVLEQRVADRRAHGPGNVSIFLQSGARLILPVSPFGLAPRYIYNAATTRYSFEPHEDLIELDVQLSELDEIILVNLNLFSSPAPDRSAPTIKSILDCEWYLLER